MLDYIVSLKNHRNPSGLYDNNIMTWSPSLHDYVEWSILQARRTVSWIKKCCDICELYCLIVASKWSFELYNWSFEQLPLVQRIINTVEKTSTGVTPAKLILTHSIRLSAHIMTPISNVDSSDTSLSDRMDEWISRQHTLLFVAQENQLKSDQH